MDSVLLLRQIPASLHTDSYPTMTINNRFIYSYNELGTPDSGLDSRSPDLYSNNSLDCPSTPGDLVSLAWLQKGDILQIAPLDGEDDSQTSFPPPTTSISLVKNDVVPKLDLLNEDYPKQSPIEFHSVHSNTNRLSISTSTTLQRPTSSIDYCSPQHSIDSPQLQPTTTINHFNPNGQGLTKPNYSYTHLIFMAIESTPQKCMTVNQIYNWCELNFPFYKHAGAGWKNSLRHNLSINKSFKRLPRDSRGPGRGAFWTVEPRERATLLDAIKRNPWNFTNVTALMATQSECNGQASLVEITNPQYYGIRRLGLTQSAPGQLLRSQGLGQQNGEFTELHFDRLGNLVATSSALKICSSAGVDGTMVGDSAASLSEVEHANGSNVLNACDTGCEKSAFLEWSEGEEEKYLCSLRSLAESMDPVNGDDALRNCDQAQDGPLFHAESKMSTTKQRRKSRLQPTRIVEDSYASAPNFDVRAPCNECKENATNGCEACHTRRSFISSRSPIDSTSFRERALADVVNALDSDQEHGPAGGPAVRKVRKPTNHTTGDPLTATDPVVRSNSDEEVGAEEVYVTPAPYIDHEYAHCQTQLRGPDDARLVERYNENYCNQMMKCLARSRSYTKRGRLLRIRGMNEVKNYKVMESGSSGENYSLDESEMSDSSHISVAKHSSDNISRAGVTTRMSRRPKYAPTLPCARSYKPDSYVSHASKKKLIGKNAVHPHRHSATHVREHPMITKISRRSQRVIKAPKRPYDDYENTLTANIHLPPVYSESPHDSDHESTSETYETVVRIYDHRNANRLSKSTIRDLRLPRRQPKKRGRKHASRRFSRAQAYSDESSDTDEEMLYLHYASKRQQMGKMTRHRTSRSSTPPKGSSVRDRAASLKHDHWGRWHSEYSHYSHQSYIESDVDPVESNPEFDGDCVEEEIIEEEILSEESKTEAAHSLLAIKQMQNFRLQSGYLSLDSSGSGETLVPMVAQHLCFAKAE